MNSPDGKGVPDTERKDVKIVFMGTPDFALPVLEALNDNYDVICCVTKADKPKGRGGKVSKSPVKERCEELGIPVLAPEKIKTPEFYEELGGYKADFFVTCAYGKILPQEILDMPLHGTVNVHASLLPKYRGSAPIWRVIMNGEKVTGITTMLTDIGMDTGDILLREEVPIGPDMTTGELHDALAPVGAKLIVKTLDGILDGTVTPQKQDHEQATYAPPVTAADCLIDWSKSAEEIHDLVRGLNPAPGAFSYIGGKLVKIFEAAVAEDCAGTYEYGEVTGKTKKGLKVKCGEGSVTVTELQFENSKRMSASSYLNGHEISGRFTDAR